MDFSKFYLPEILKGLGLTMKHVFKNLAKPSRMQTVEYPDVRKRLPPAMKLEHRLMQRPDGTIRCTACMCCATACPADCITIVAGDHPDPTIEKYAVSYTIDALKCIYCGFCVEACPCDAIRMDTQKLYRVDYTREAFVHDTDYLLNNHPDGLDPVSCYLETDHGHAPEEGENLTDVPHWNGGGLPIPRAKKLPGARQSQPVVGAGHREAEHH
ncbi:MAG: NuoI/complex I 23 kDa subunit family protein [Myxococcota bacterium]